MATYAPSVVLTGLMFDNIEFMLQALIMEEWEKRSHGDDWENRVKRYGHN